jgi:E3 ubiquitin-protein ligase DOA10
MIPELISIFDDMMVSLEKFYPKIFNKINNQLENQNAEKELEKYIGGDAKMAKQNICMSKRAYHEEWEEEDLDKRKDKLIKLFKEFTEHRKSNNAKPAKLIGDLLLKNIPDYTSDVVQMFNRDAKEATPDDTRVEKIIENLKLWNQVLKMVREYMSEESPKPSSKPIGPEIKRKPQVLEL